MTPQTEALLPESCPFKAILFNLVAEVQENRVVEFADTGADGLQQSQCST